MMSNFFYFLRNPMRWYREHKAWKKRLADLRKRDPFIYK
jgi:hypothetical protein